MIKMDLLKHQKKRSKFLMIMPILTLVIFLFPNFLSTGIQLDKEKLMMVLVSDFSKSYKSQFKRNKIFFISPLYSRENKFSIFNIGSMDNKVILSPDGTGYYPKDYISYKDKIFFIDGEITSAPTTSVFDVLKKNDLIDSSLYKVEKGLIKFEDLKEGDGKELLDEKKKIATYVVCKKTNKVVSTWITNKYKVDERKMKKALKKACK